jgi:hypothetical protein
MHIGALLAHDSRDTMASPRIDFKNQLIEMTIPA